jgi:hypothetical protein
MHGLQVDETRNEAQRRERRTRQTCSSPGQVRADSLPESARLPFCSLTLGETILKLFWHGYSLPLLLLLVFMASFGLSGCDGDDGATGAAGAAGLAGSDGADGVNHVGTTVENIVNIHDTLACQVCHVPTFARNTSTKVEWYWADAGQDIDPIPVDLATGRPTYDKKKGTFVWANNVRPTLRYFSGKYDWNLALQDGAAVTGQTYTGAYEFVDTEMFLSVNHGVAPKEMAYGMDGHCDDCHFSTQIDWSALGWSGDPLSGGTRP